MKSLPGTADSNSQSDEGIVPSSPLGESTASQQPIASVPAGYVSDDDPQAKELHARELHTRELIPNELGTTAGHHPGPANAFALHSSASDSVGSPVSDSEKTVISQRPVAAPEEFYRSMPLAELANLLEGKQLDHFLVEQMIGGGGMGAVFRGRDLRLDRIVAIKVIPASKRDAETLRRFRLEAQSAARLDHPNIARVYYVGEAERWNYIVFEYIEGVNVRDLVDMQGPLSVDDAVFFTRQVAEALQHATDRNVVHRDIKPSNLLVTPAGAAKVVDMGLARDTSLDKSSADATASGVTLGTFDYISPEQARNPRDADVRSDLYSLGCTMFFMLTGNPPFPEGTALQKLLNHGSQPPPDPRAWREDLSDELYEILMKMMAKRPADRYQKPIDLINDLLLLAEAEGLARSRSPGTVMMTPSVAQRSLLEANAPWMVAAVVLLGSTLWMQSVQSISSTFTIPEATFVANVKQGERFNEEAKSEGLPSLPPSSEATRKSEGAARSNELNNPSVGESNEGAAALQSALKSTERAALAKEDSSQLPRQEIPALPGPTSVSPKTSETMANSAVRTLPPSALPGADNVATETFETDSTLSNPPSSESELTGVGAARSISTLVVCERLPVGVDRQAWASSLADALRRAEIETEIRTIEIIGRVTVDSSVRIARPDLVMRAGTPSAVNLVDGLGSRATIEFAPSLLARLQPGESLFEIAGQALQCLDLNFDVTLAADTPTRDLSLFGVGPNGKLDLDGCRVTIKGTLPSSLPSVVTVAGNEPRGSGLTGMPLRFDERTKGSAAEPSSISLKNSVVRGNATLLKVAASQRIEIELKQVLVGVVGYAVDVLGVANDDRLPPTLRIYCQHTTFATAEGFARVLYRTDSAPSLAINRNSKNCVYWSQADKPHFQIEGVQRSDDLDDLMHLQGGENAYDAKIAQLCKCLARDEADVAFQFSSAEAPWFQEYGNEWSVSWQNPLPKLDRLFELEISDFGLKSGMFMPGYEPATLAPTLLD